MAVCTTLSLQSQSLAKQNHLVIIAALIQITVPIEFRCTRFTQGSQIIESLRKVYVFGFKSFKSLEQQRFGILIQFQIERIDLLHFAPLLRLQISQRWTGYGGIVLLEWYCETQVERLLENVLGNLESKGNETKFR